MLTLCHMREGGEGTGGVGMVDVWCAVCLSGALPFVGIVEVIVVKCFTFLPAEPKPQPICRKCPGEDE